MKLLAVARKIDRQDHAAGFMYGWMKAIAREVDELMVICLERGDCQGIGKNVIVESMGGEEGVGKLKKLLNYRKLLKEFLPQVDAMIVFQNPIYAILAGGLARRYHKKMVMWYAHGHAGFDLKLASRFVDLFLTSSSPGFRLKTKKPIKVIGQGIDTRRFTPKFKIQNPKFKGKEYFSIISVGRISPVKDYETLIEAAKMLSSEGKNIIIKIIGSPGLEGDKTYLADLQRKVEERGLTRVVKFIGPVPNEEIHGYLQGSHVFVNTSSTGSLDKAVLEAMASGTLVVSGNEAYQEMLAKINQNLIFQGGNPQDLAVKINAIMDMSTIQRENIVNNLRQEVINNHSLERWAGRVVENVRSVL